MSWAAEITIDDTYHWVSDHLRFATQGEANSYAVYLAAQRTVWEVRFVESGEAISHRWNTKTSKAVPLRTRSAGDEKWSRIPTQQEIAEFDGKPGLRADCYAEATRTGWRCPSCGRNAPQCIRWTKIHDVSWRAAYRDACGMGFVANLVRYECGAKNYGYSVQRFSPALLCSDCASSNTLAKRRLILPEAFYFSPEEIGRFVQCVPYSGQKLVDYEIANEIYDSEEFGFFEDLYS